VKSVEVVRDYGFRVSAKVIIQYKGGETYHRVPEAQVRAIVDAGAGKIVRKVDE
jgi:hypothetical protein